MDGVLNVFKPAGPTSHDIIYRVRRAYGEKKVGHAGTLDPMATGVLVVCVGRATRIVEYLMGATKAYVAEMILGVATDTQDSTGNIESKHDASGVTRDALEDAAKRFVGEIEQTPPMVSAIKRDGKPLYKLARQGKTVEREPRRVCIHSLRVDDFRPGEKAWARIKVECSSGTYIRTLCADIGEALGVGGHMSALRRTRVGDFRIESSKSVEDGSDLPPVISMDAALEFMPSVRLSGSDAGRLAHGLSVAATTQPPGVCRVHGPDGELVAIGEVVPEGLLRPRKVLAGCEIEGCGER